MSESLDAVELGPLGGLGVVDIDGESFADGVGPAADDRQHAVDEQTRVLVPPDRQLLVRLIRGANPVPPTLKNKTKKL